MDILRAHPGPTSAVSGVIVGLVLFWVGGRSSDPVGLLLPVLLGAVFAIAMYASARAARR